MVEPDKFPISRVQGPQTSILLDVEAFGAVDFDSDSVILLGRAEFVSPFCSELEPEF